MWVLGPILNFTYRPGAKRLVFLAQGIRIKPVRSKLVYARAHNLNIHTTLIHVDSGGHTFAPLTRQLASLAHFPTNPEEFTAFVKEAAKDKDAVFYLSGSPKFVFATRKTLHSLGVGWRRVKADTFLGY
jgi:ferredoxin-NADP reductase